MNRRVLLGLGAALFAIWSIRGQAQLRDAVDRQAEATARLAASRAAPRPAAAPVTRVIEHDRCPAGLATTAERGDRDGATRPTAAGGDLDPGADLDPERIDRASRLVDDAIAAGSLDGQRAADVQAALIGLDRESRLELVLRLTRAANAGRLAIADRRQFPL